MSDADLLRRILGAMRPDVPLRPVDEAWLAAKGLDTLEATARDILAADPTLICPDPAAHEGVTFTVDSLAPLLEQAFGGLVDGDEPDWRESAAIIKAAKEASE